MTYIMSMVVPVWRLVHNRIAGFTQASSANVATEFAIVFPVFSIIMLAIIDFGLTYYAISQAEIGVLAAKENLVATTRPTSISDIKNIICTQVPQTINCDTAGFYVQVSQLTANSPGSGDPTGDAYNLVAGDVNMIRVIYPWTNILPTDVLNFIGLDIPKISLRVNIFFYAKS